VTKCGALGASLSTILEAIGRRAAALQKEEFLHRQLDAELIQTLDRDGDGVDRAECVSMRPAPFHALPRHHPCSTQRLPAPRAVRAYACSSAV
jgi:hypothetical protein